MGLDSEGSAAGQVILLTWGSASSLGHRDNVPVRKTLCSKKAFTGSHLALVLVQNGCAIAFYSALLCPHKSSSIVFSLQVCCCMAETILLVSALR